MPHSGSPTDTEMPAAPRLADTLAETAGLDELVELIENPATAVSEAALMAALRRFPDSQRLHAAMISRPSLPSGVAACLSTITSDSELMRLLARHEFPSGRFFKLFQQSRNRPSWWNRAMRGSFLLSR